MASRKSSKYRATRDATRTTAPSGADTVGSSGRARDRPTRGAGRRRSRQGAVATRPILGVTITHPQKALWPNGGDGRPVTKRDFAQYLAAAGEWMLPHIAGRPCSLVRCPDGIDGQRWNCAPQRPQVPGRLVFDLDPAPDVSLQNVIAAARELRERLEALGPDCFLETTGGKGLHVVVPCAQPRNATLDWPLVKSFAREVCARMAADSPRRYVINMARRRTLAQRPPA
jgi:bifunctional non-homologous end joining protein LigD